MLRFRLLIWGIHAIKLAGCSVIPLVALCHAPDIRASEGALQESTAEKVQQLVSMGFDRSQVEAAFLRCSTVEAAMNWILDGSAQ